MDAQWSSISAQLNGSFLEKEIRRTNRNLLLTGLVLLAGVVVYGIAERRYVYNFFAGPFAADAESLDAFGPPDAQLRYFVKVKGQELSDTGIQEIETQTRNGSVESRTVKAKYSILVLGKRLLIVKSNPSDSGTTFQGEISEIPSDVRAQIITPLMKEHPNANAVFVQLMLDATGFRFDGYIAFAICIPLTLFAGWLILKVMRRTSAPERHPIVKSISKYGSLVETAQQLDIDLRGNTEKFGRARVTQSWVLLPSAFGLATCNIPNLIWAYKKITRRYYNGIPTGKTYAVIMYDRCGQPLTLPGREKKVDAVLAVLAQRTPWAVFGYTDQLNNALKTNWGALTATVDARRTERNKV